MKRSAVGVSRSMVKVTGSIVLDPVQSSSFSSLHPDVMLNNSGM